MSRPTDPAITIRLAALSEHAALESLMFAASIAVQAQREAIMANPSVIGLPAKQISDGRVYVAERNGQVVGFSALLPRHDGDAQLDGLFVRPDAWRSGIGARLVALAEATAAQWGAATLHVVANRHAELFYRACGFVRFSEQRTLFDIALLMKKSVNCLG